MTKKDYFKRAVLNSGREKRMHAGIWVIEEQVRERERNRGAWDKSGIVSFK